MIKHMVNRFLMWRLPADFHPDGGVSFQPHGNAGTGTNLLDARQAEEMVRFITADMPQAEEIVWLIERRTDQTIPKWWGPDRSRWDWHQALVAPDMWTTDASKAIRFARKEDAEAVIRFEGFGGVAIAMDRMWL